MDEYKDEAENEQFLREQLTAAEQFYGLEHPDLLTPLLELAEFYQDQHRYAEAEPLYLRWLSLQERRYTVNSPEVGQALVQLADFYQKRTNQLDQAETYYLRALAIYERLALPTDEKAVLRKLVTLIHDYMHSKRHTEAESLSWQLLELCQNRSARFDDQLSRLIIQRDIYLKAKQGYSSGVTEDNAENPDPIIQCALDALRALSSLARQLKAPDERTTTIQFQKKMAQHWREQGEDNAARQLEQAYQRLEAIQETDSPNQEPYQASKELYQRILAWEENHLGPHHLELASSIMALGTIATQLQNHKEAEALYRRALTIYETYYDPENTSVITGKHLVEQAQFLQEMQGGNILASLSRPDSALNRIKAQSAQRREEAMQRLQRLGRPEAVEQLRRQSRKVDMQTQSTLLSQQALQARQKGDYQEAESLYKQAIDLNTNLFGLENSMTVMQMDNLASLYIDMKRFTEAEDLYRRVAATFEKLRGFGPDHLSTGRAYGELGYICQQQQRCSEAEKLYQQALALFLQQCGRDNVYSTMLIERYARLLLDTKREEEANKLEKDPLAFLAELLAW